VSINWERVAKISVVLLVPGGSILGAYWLYKHYLDGKQSTPFKPYKACLECEDCIVMLRARGYKRWMDHLQDEHNCTVKQAEDTLTWIYNLKSGKEGI
jgi:hypothetical protein